MLLVKVDQSNEEVVTVVVASSYIWYQLSPCKVIICPTNRG